MQRAGKEENVSNLVTWLHQEATFAPEANQTLRMLTKRNVPTEDQHLEDQRATLLAMRELLIKKGAHLVVRGNTIWLPVRCIKVQL